MTSPPRWPVARYCRCGRLQQMHIHRPAARRLPEWGGTDDGSCAGYDEVRVEGRPDENELRRQLADARARLDRIVTFLRVKADFQGLHVAWAATVVRIALGQDGAVIDGTVVDETAAAPVRLELDGPDDIGGVPC